MSSINIKTIQEIMRKDSGVDGDVQRLHQLVWIIYLKIFDYAEEEAELNNTYVPIIPEGYRWRDWAIGKSLKEQLTGDELLSFVNNKLLPVLSGNAISDENNNMVVIFDKNDEVSLQIKSFISSSINYMKNGYLLRELINYLNEINFEDVKTTNEFNNIYESLLKNLSSAGTMGEFYTHRAITSFCIEKIDPKPGQKIADWAAGTGGFLVSAIDHVKSQIKKGDIEAFKLLEKCIIGGELKPMPYKLNVTNLMLHGIQLPNIRYGDSLAEKYVNDFTEDEKVHRAALNPPYGGIALEEALKCFPVEYRSSETSDLFVVLTIKRLLDKGKAVMILPDGFLFGKDNTKTNIKKLLLKECNLHTIIRLPGSCFAPYTSIATNLLFFDKGQPTENVWFYRMDLINGQKFSLKKNPITRDKLACIDEWWDNRVEIKDEKIDESITETWKSRCVSIEEIVNSGYSLDFCGYPVKEKVILSPEETIKNFQMERDRLDKEMDKKLNEILSLLGISKED